METKRTCGEISLNFSARNIFTDSNSKEAPCNPGLPTTIWRRPVVFVARNFIFAMPFLAFTRVGPSNSPIFFVPGVSLNSIRVLLSPAAKLSSAS